jgi:TatD-related deoxyribonuclease
LVLFADAHTHTNPIRGLGASRIAEKFKKEGGWFMALISLSPWNYALDFKGLDSYKEVIEILLDECKSAEEQGLKVACFSGFHPGDIDILIDRFRMDPTEVLKLGLKVIDYIANLCKEGVLDGIGEVGRQHYKTSPERVVISEIILRRAMMYARDYGCKVHMHLENQGRITVDLILNEIDLLRDNVDLKTLKKKLLFHHLKPSLVKEAWKEGFYSTVPGLLRVLEYAFKELEPIYMVESDHADDPSRPGSVTYPWDMIRAQKALLRQGIVNEEYLYKINIDNVVKYYEVEPP